MLSVLRWVTAHQLPSPSHKEALFLPVPLQAFDKDAVILLLQHWAVAKLPGRCLVPSAAPLKGAQDILLLRHNKEHMVFIKV